MEVKKKTFLENLRIKTKLPNLKKPAKKTPKKQGKKLAYRRSLSVPDLRFPLGDQTDLSPMDSAQLTGRSDAIFFGTSPGQSDTDSIASGSIASGHIFTDQLSDTVENPAESPYRITAPVEPVETLHEVEEVVDGVDGSEIYSQIDTSSKVRFKDDLPATPAVAGLPVPAPRRTGMITPTRTMSVGREDISPECLLTRSRRGGVGSIVRSNSFEDEKSPYTEKLAPVVQRKKLSSNQRAIRYDRWSMPADEPVEASAEGASLDQACGTPSEERVSMPWTDSDPDREVLSPFFSEVLSMEECQLDEATEESLEISEQGDTFDDAILDPADGSVPMPLPLQRYRLNIDLKEGKNLVVRDKRSGTSDPYVKFKLEGKQFYKSKVVYKNLNPRWNESFSHPLRDREHVVEVRVYDKNRTTDEFMGSTTITLKDLELYKTIQMELPLADPKSKENDMGVIIVDVCIMFRDATIKRSPRWPVKKNKPQGGPQQQNQVQTQGQRSAAEAAQKNQLKNHVWTRVFSITLVEGQDLPHHGDADIHVRFRLGDQKYRSKNLCIQANPQWREQFDFNHYEDNQEPLQVEVFSKRGRKCEESWGMFESDLSNRPFNERQVFTHVLDQGKGRLVFLVTQKPCSGVSISDMNAAPLEQPDEKDTIVEKYSLKNSHRGMAEVGFLQVKVIRATDLTAADLNGKSDPFCVLELGNSRLQTQTIPKTLNPEWNKVFTFPIKDIHDVVELIVFDDNTDKAPNLLGKVAIPLLTVQNGQQICRQLKKEDLVRASKGTITLVLDVIYNKVRAGVKSFGPKEEKYTEEIPKFAKKVLAQNIYRVRKITTAVLYTLQYIKSCFQWESTQRSLIAFLVFLLTVWHFEPFMLPLFLLLLIGWNYFKLYSGKASSTNNLDLENNMGSADDEEEDEKEPGKTGLMDKIHMVQEVILAIQNMLDEIASVGERIKNTFNWSVPFMSCLTCLLLFLATVVLYYIPVRYMVLLWGANRFTAKLRNPYAIDNNEILDFLKRVPCDVQKVQYSELRAPGVQGPPRRRK